MEAPTGFHEWFHLPSYSLYRSLPRDLLLLQPVLYHQQYPAISALAVKNADVTVVALTGAVVALAFSLEAHRLLEEQAGESARVLSTRRVVPI